MNETPMTWTWEYFSGQYIIRRVDRTKQVAFEAPRHKRNNVAVHDLCEWLDDLEYAPTAPSGAEPGDKSRRTLEAAITQNLLLTREVLDRYAAEREMVEEFPPLDCLDPRVAFASCYDALVALCADRDALRERAEEARHALDCIRTLTNEKYAYNEATAYFTSLPPEEQTP